MRYRVKQEVNGAFYPQYKRFLFWQYFWYKTRETLDIYDRGDRVHAFDTFEEAENFVKQKKKYQTKEI